MRRRPVGAWFVALVAVAHAALWGCGAGGDSPYYDQGMSDASAGDLGQPIDNGVTDQGIDPHADVLPAAPARFAPFLSVAATTFGPLHPDEPAPWTSCYATNQGCDSAPCALLASCCVADGNCADPQLDGDVPPALLFTTCASGASALTCVPGQPLVALGNSTPTVEAGGLRPGGDATREGGVLVGQPLDLRVDRVDLSVVFVPPLACPGNACLESAGVSLARADELLLGVVNPLVSLLYSPSRGDVSLMVGDQRRAAWPLTDPDTSFTLEVHPSGVARVRIDEELQAGAFSYALDADAQVVLHGRNTELQGARVRSLHALQYRSEAPTVFDARVPITLTAPVDVSPWAPHDASVVEHEGHTYVVVENDGALFRGELVGNAVVFDSAQRVVVEMGREDRLLAPALLVRPSGETFLLYTAVLPDGARAIHARHGVDGALGPLPDLLAVAVAPEGDSLDDPSVIEHGGRVLLLLRHRYADGRTELELWRSEGSAPSTLRALQPAPASNLGSLTEVASSLSTREQQRAPYLSVRGGTYRVHFERRFGTRSVIEVLVGDELRAFRRVGEVLAPRMGEQDSLGVGSPSAMHAADGVERLFYMGRDGVADRLFVTEREGVLDPLSLREL